MGDIVIVALIVAISGGITPWILSRIAAKQRRIDKLEDWARQDEVAAKVEMAAKVAQSTATLLVESNAEIASTAAAATQAIRADLGEIHSLVNSAMTEAKQSEYDAVARELVMMEEVIDLKRAAGHEPTPAALAAVLATRAKLIDLGSILQDRIAQQNANLNP